VASGNGLENMRRRLAAISGKCEIESTPGKGTKVTFAIQLKVSAFGKVGL
jgi:signal transduction histidine kinase